MNKLKSSLAIALVAFTITSCKKNDEPIITIPPSDGNTLTLEGKTAESNYANVVYADLSADKTSKVDRKAWALGFYAGADFKVILNQSFQTLAGVVNKTDINAVTVDDAKTSLVYNYNTQALGNPEAVKLVDYYDGNLAKTAIATVSANDAENKVYILGVNGLFTAPNLYKIRVLRNGANGYTLQYAKVEEATFKSLNIAKNTAFNAIFVSLGNNNDGVIVNAEPQQKLWDIQWSYSIYRSVSATPDSGPYFYQDFIAINNLGGVQAVEVKKAVKSYADFAESDIAALNFSSNRDVIGSNWRVTTGTGIVPDTFYVIKDSAGNVYKLKFVSMGVGNDGGERGKPVIEYKLIKKGS